MLQRIVKKKEKKPPSPGPDVALSLSAEGLRSPHRLSHNSGLGGSGTRCLIPNSCLWTMLQRWHNRPAGRVATSWLRDVGAKSNQANCKYNMCLPSFSQSIANKLFLYIIFFFVFKNKFQCI